MAEFRLTRGPIDQLSAAVWLRSQFVGEAQAAAERVADLWAVQAGLRAPSAAVTDPFS